MNVQRLTEEFLFLHQDIASCLSQGLINRSSLARLISETYELEGIDAAAAACRRVRLTSPTTENTKLANSTALRLTSVKAHLIVWQNRLDPEKVLVKLPAHIEVKFFLNNESTSSTANTCVITEPANSNAVASIIEGNSIVPISVDSADLTLVTLEQVDDVLSTIRMLSDLFSREQIAPIALESTEKQIELLLTPAAAERVSQVLSSNI